VWTAVVDNRNETLYVAASGAQYLLGAEVDGNSYDGLGAIPAWLTTTAPPPPAPPEPVEGDGSGSGSTQPSGSTGSSS